MAKAGRTTTVTEMPNLRFIRTGLTIQSHVAVAGEVIPLPNGFTALSEEEQLDMYGVVHYQRTADPVNIGPTAKAAFVRLPEPEREMGRPSPESQGVPGYSDIKRGGGAATVEAQVLTPHAPDPLTVPGYEDKKTVKEMQKQKQEEVKAGDLAAPKSVHKKTSSHKADVIVLRRKPIKKKLVAARATRMEKRRK